MTFENIITQNKYVLIHTLIPFDFLSSSYNCLLPTTVCVDGFYNVDVH